MDARLATIADAIVQKHTRAINLTRWEEPQHAHLLKAPSAFVDDVMQHLSDDGTRGDPLPWTKAAQTLRLRPHELTIWAGSNGSAKSTVLSEILLSLASADRKVVVISLEMPAYKVAAKMVAQAFCNRHPVRVRVERWAEAIGDSLCFLDLTGDLPPQDAIKLMRYCAHELGTQHILLDNLTKVISADNDHAEEQRKFMAQAHRTAIDTGMHIHVVAHTRKPADEGKAPGRYEIAGSRTLSDQPDNVVMIWRNRTKDEKRQLAPLGALEDAEEPDVKLRIDKQRHGDYEGNVGLWMARHCYRFVGTFGDDVHPYAREQ